jgi:hypothetical protein
MRGIHCREFQELAPIGKRVEDKVIDMFHVSGGKIEEYWRHGDDPTDFLHQLGTPDRPSTPTPRNSSSCILTGFLGVSERQNVSSDADQVLVVVANRFTLGTFATCACYR